MRRVLFLLVLLALPFSAIGCGSDEPPPPTYIEDEFGNVILIDQYGNRLN